MRMQGTARVLVGPQTDDLAELYAVPAGSGSWLRVNMVSTVDGAATGEGGLSGGINNPADKQVFDTLRGLSDAVLVGAGTARAEGYGPVDKPIVLVSRGASVPGSLRDAEPGLVQLATVSDAEHLDEARSLLGPDHVHVVGSSRVDLVELRARLGALGLRHVLCEGGPHLLRDLLDQGAVDEIDATTVPAVLAGDHPRITAGGPLDVRLRLNTLLEDDGTLLARWLVSPLRVE